MNKEELAHRFVFYLLKEKEFFKRRDTHTHTIIKFKPFHARFHFMRQAEHLPERRARVIWCPRNAHQFSTQNA